ELAWPVHEPRRLGLVLTGARQAKSWTGGGDPADYYDLKGSVEDVLEAMGISDPRFQPGPHAPLHPASASQLVVAGQPAGHLEQVTLFDVYRGPPVPEGRKSVAFGLSLRALDRTLTDAEADALCAAIRDRLKARVRAEIRA